MKRVERTVVALVGNKCDLDDDENMEYDPD